MAGQKWTEQELDLLEEAYEITSREDLLDLFPGRSWESIKLKAQRHFSLERDWQLRKTCKVNTEFFSNLNLLNCYWGGFLAADGCIQDTRNRRAVSIGLHIKDIEHLRIFCYDTGHTGMITEHNGKSCHLSVQSVPQWVNDLERYFSLTPRKSKTLLPPNVYGEHALSYIIGYIDGDGCIFKSDRQLGFHLVGTENVLVWILNTLKGVWYKEPRKNDVSPRKIKDTSAYQVACKSTWAEYVLTDLKKIQVPKLARKWDLVPG
jgi:hypothetical protein